MTPAERASAFKARWWAISHGWSARLDEADLREAFAAAESSALERAAHRLEEIADEALERAAQLALNPYGEEVQCYGGDEPFAVGKKIAKAIRALASPAAAPAAEPEPEIVEGCEHNPLHLRMRPPSEPVAPSLLPRVLAALDEHGYWVLAAELRRYIAEMGAGHAEAPDAERDRNRHNAMLVGAWRGEFNTLCKALFPGDDGPIGWKHIHAKIAELLAASAAPHAKGEGTT